MITHRPGDKVRVKRVVGEQPSVRGVLTAVASDHLTVRLDKSSIVLTVSAQEITNFSLAARKAWANMPNRNVGRPKGSKVCDRLSVTVRVDRSLWREFLRAEDEGVINDRTATLNGWIHDGLQRARARRRRAS